MNVGAGYSMLFQYYKWCILILVWVLCSGGLLNIYDNFHAIHPKCTKSNLDEDAADSNECIDLFATKSSIVNKMNLLHIIYQGYGSNVGTVFVIILVFQMLRKVQRDVSHTMDAREASPEDWTIMVEGFPKI